MTLLLREVIGFVAEAGLWLLLLAATTGIVAAAVLYASERAVDRTALFGALISGGGAAALAHRLGITLWAPDVAGRPLPVVWAATAAAAAASVLVARRRRAGS